MAALVVQQKNWVTEADYLMTYKAESVYYLIIYRKFLDLWSWVQGVLKSLPK